MVVFIACLHSFSTKNKVQSHKKVCENKDFCNIIPSEDTKKSEFNMKNMIKHHLLFMQILSV